MTSAVDVEVRRHRADRDVRQGGHRNCRTCNKELEYAGRGRPAERCRQCNYERERAYDRQRAHKGKQT